MMEKKYFGSNINLVIFILLLLNVLFGIYIAFIKPSAYSLETLKVGGRENMKMAMQLYKSDMYKNQQKIFLEQFLESLNQSSDTNDSNSSDGATVSKTLTPEQRAAIAKDAYIFGKKDARITLVEYSDFLCPFCKRHYTSQTLENLVKKYPDDVNMIFKQMPLAQLHPTAPLGAQGAVCVGKLGGSEKFYAYIAEAFKAEEFTEDSVIKLAKNLGIKTSSFKECLTHPDTIAAVNAQIQEAQSFGINGTPGNLIVDNQKGTYIVVAGAYPIETFEAEIKKILGK